MGENSSGISGRFRKLLREFSQAEIARRCEIPPSNLSRYVNGQRVPAEVCGAIVRNLGVNPLWLLTGEGSMFGAQADPPDQAAAGLRRLLDQLSQSSARTLEAIPKTLQGGSLANLRRDLSNLSEVNRQLNDRTKALYAELLEELIAAMDAFEHPRAERVLQQLHDLEIVCPDPKLVRQRRNLEAVRLLEHSRPMEALEIQRALFAEALASFSDIGKPQLMQEFNFIATLRSCGYCTEARAYARALTELRKPLEEHAEYWLLLVLGAFLEIEMGELSTGLEQLSRSLARVPEKYKHENYSMVICAYLLQGTLTLEGARASEVARVAARPPNERVVSALSLLRFGACVDAKATLAQILADFADVHEFMAGKADCCIHYADALADIEQRGGPPAKVFASFRGRLSDEGGLPGVDATVLATRFAVLYALPGAIELWRGAQAAIDALGPQRVPRLLTRWLHARNTLHLRTRADSGEKALGDRAREAETFISHYIAKGFVAFGTEIRI